MLLANIRVDGRFLTPDERGNVHGLMQSHGRLTPVELGKYVGQMTGSKNTNIKASFEIHPDSKDALVLDPVKAFCAKAAQPPGKKSRFEISMFWPHLPDVVRKRAEGRWRKRRRVDLYWMRDQLKLEGADVSALEATIESAWNADQKNRKPIFLTKGHLLRKHFSPEWPSGRAPYSRKVMREVARASSHRPDQQPPHPPPPGHPRPVDAGHHQALRGWRLFAHNRHCRRSRQRLAGLFGHGCRGNVR